MSLEKGTSLEELQLANAPTLAIGTVSALAPGATPTVVNVGTAQNAVLDIALPSGATGAQGIQGNPGTPGSNGANPAITIGTVTTLAPGTPATAAIDSTGYPALVLNLGIPQGAVGSGTTFAWGAATGTIADQTDLKAALDLKAPLASPTLTGNPTAPTPATGDNDTSIATTAFVAAALGAAGYATLASPALTGNPTAPTPTAGDNDSSVATTGFVHNELSGYASLASPAMTGNPTAAGNLIGYRNLPTSRTVAANITLADSDKGKKILISGSRTVTLNPSSSTAIDADAIGTIVNTGTGTITLSRGVGVTAKLMGTGADANRSIAAGGVATWMKVGTDDFLVGGPGVS